MKLSFYITKESFGLYDCPRERLETLIDRLLGLSMEISSHSDRDSLYVTNDAYSIVWKKYSLSDIWSQTCSMDKDSKMMIRKILLEYSKPTDFSIAQVAIEVSQNNEQYRSIIIKACDDKSAIIADNIDIEKEDWYSYHRGLLGKYPINGDYFIDECKSYFPNIYFHNRTKDSVRQILTEFSERIVHHLSGLNDLLHKLKLEFPKLNRGALLAVLSQNQYGDFDETATLEGNASRKEDFSFNFPLVDKQLSPIEKVCCEPHIKLCHANRGSGDTSYHTDKRIYFHEGKAHIQGGRVLVGHIGKHL